MNSAFASQAHPASHLLSGTNLALLVFVIVPIVGIGFFLAREEQRRRQRRRARWSQRSQRDI